MSWLSEMFGGGSDAPPPPDYSPIINSLRQNAGYGQQLAREQFEWAKNVYNENKGFSDLVRANLLKAQGDAYGDARRDRMRYEQVFQPLEDKLIHDADTYASPENMERMRGRAMAGVGQQFEAQRQNTMRDLESYGINPGAVRYAGLDSGWRAAQAAAQAAAANQSDLATEATGRALRSEAINVGRTLPGQAVGEAGAAMNAGTGGVNVGLANTASGANTMGTGTQWYGGANAVESSAGNLMHTGYGDQMAKYKADQSHSSGLGTALGFAGSLAADYFLPGSGSVVRGMMGGGGGPQGGSWTNPDSGGTWKYAEGGEVPVSASPSRGQAIDDVPARLTPGEFVFPREAVEFYGTQKLQAMIAKARDGADRGPAKPQTRQALPAEPTYRSPGARAMALPVR